MKNLISYALGAAALLATSALAQTNYNDTSTDPNRGTYQGSTTPSPTLPDRMREPSRSRPPSKVGMELQLGGGVEGFVSRDAAAVAKPGGDWTARFIVGTRSHIAGEAAYLGSAQNLDTLGVSDRAVLLSNGFEGALRLNALTGMVQPYAVAGYTWRRYSVTNSAVNTSSVAASDNVSAIPVGVGLAFRFSRLVADLRVTYHGAFGRELIPNASLSTLSGNAKLGFEF